ncbi:MAG: hypothetical protein IPN36_06855 [Bacteroidetes bacterium]|nr:hypothetical protein [Bacteroidota bacterium]
MMKRNPIFRVVRYLLIRIMILAVLPGSLKRWSSAAKPGAFGILSTHQPEKPRKKYHDRMKRLGSKRQGQQKREYEQLKKNLNLQSLTVAYNPNGIAPH